ncbi:hypothetical protein GCM10027449_21620 [Sinomonas notoginsengisoli]|uniref:hypothetical protein n=1 Tax=Sinomonas notoginsengisoli TaxID=1457311 RepID=UPI001F30CA29|nr:hypothetical protein [Sinomonas notoginsengisoli]
MQNLLVALTQTPPSPEGTLRPGLSEDMITPGTWGFIATAFVVVLTIFLIVDMVRRLRRIRYKAQVEEALASEQGDAKEADPRGTEARGAGSHDRRTDGGAS